MATKQKGRGYFTEFMLNGNRYRAQFDTFEEGDRWEKDVRHEVAMGRVPKSLVRSVSRTREGLPGVWRELRDYALKHHYEVNTPRSLDWAKSCLSQVTEYIGTETPIADIDKVKLDALRDYFRQAGNSDATVNRKLAVTSKCLTIAMELGVIDKKPKVPLTKKRQGRVRFLTKEEETAMLNTLTLWSDKNMYDLITCALDTGARQGELFKAEWVDISPAFEHWTFWETKGDQPRTIPLTKRVRAILRRRKDIGQKGPFIGMTKSTLRSPWERLISALEFDDVVFHTLRHTCASRLVQSGVDLRRVQVWMGHKRIETTLIYAHLAPRDLEVVRDVLETA